jgi:hypothetical protein
MSVVGGSASTGLVQRVQNILLKPAAEWEVIAGEPATTQGLFMGYACILAVLPLIGTLVGRVLFGSMFGGGLGMMTALVAGLVLGIVGYVLNLVLVFVVGLIINALAPSFDAKSDSIQAMKVSVYAGTALWVAGIISWFPVIGWLIGLAALGYTCYLLYLGVSRVMKPPADKAVIYTVVIIGAQILLYLIVGWITLMVGVMAVAGAAVTGAAAVGGQ